MYVIWQRHAVLTMGGCVYDYLLETEYMHMHIQGEWLREGFDCAKKVG
jgi:hypothetical protein